MAKYKVDITGVNTSNLKVLSNGKNQKCFVHTVITSKLYRLFSAIAKEKWKGITIIEAEVCLDHILLLIEIPPKYSVSSVMGFLKGKSSLMIYSKRANMRYQYRNREFWCRDIMWIQLERIQKNKRVYS